MTTVIRSLSDLHLLRDALQVDKEQIAPPAAPKVSLTVALETQDATPFALADDVPADLVELEGMLNLHNLWLGYSPFKGWALLDRKHPEYCDWNRPFLLLGNGSIDRLSRAEFSQEPNGPWRLNFWKKINSITRQEAGPATAYSTESGHSVQSKLDSRSVATRGLFFTPESRVSSNLFYSS